MLNTSVLHNNSTFSYYGCSNVHHVGVIFGCVAMSLCFFLGTPAHCWFLWFSLRDGWKLKPTQVFFFNNTVLDIIFCVECIIHTLNIVIFNNEVLCTVTLVVFGLSWFGRPLMQICICVEQYVAVLHPIIFLKYKGLRYRIASAGIVWLIAVGYGVYNTFTVIFPDPLFNCVFFTAVIVISYCCVSVLRALKHPGPGDQQITVKRGKDVGNQQKRNAFETIFTGLNIILFSYLPQISLTFIALINIDENIFSYDIIPFMYSFNVLGVMVTPLLKMYREGNLKCLNHQRNSPVNS